MSARILLADDDATVRTAVRLALVSQGYDVVGEAQDGVEALALARELQPDVLVIDLTMPGLDGLEVIATIAPALPQCRIVVFSAAAAHAYTGVDRYVDKAEGFPGVVSAVAAVTGQGR